MNSFSSGAVLKINLTAIKNNILKIKTNLNATQKFCMVLKANSYGFGSKKICKFVENFVDYFAVSSPKEFYQIKTISSRPIIILDPVYYGLKNLIENGAELTVSNLYNCYDIINICEKYNLQAKVHIAVNTGMNRFGFSDFNELIKIINIFQKSQKVLICGVFSHYFMANNKKYADLQYKRFLLIKSQISSLISRDCLFHICATDGTIFKNGFDMVRIGMGAYTDNNYQTITLYSHIIDLKSLKENEHIGYGDFCFSNKHMKVAIVGVGYGDGLPRNIIKNGYVLINDNYCKVLNICMDCILVDVTNKRTKIGDKVTLIGRDKTKQIFICDLAKWCDTIDYDIIIKLTSRVKRKYIMENENANYHRKI